MAGRIKNGGQVKVVDEFKVLTALKRSAPAKPWLRPVT